MAERDWLAERFEEQRPHLRAVAYRMLGSLSDADDAVQETWLRLSQADSDEVENLRAWLTTIVGRVSLNMLPARKSRREEPIETFSRLSPDAKPALVNGAAGVVVVLGGRPFAVMGFTVVGSRIVAIDVLSDPERLRHIELAVLDR